MESWLGRTSFFERVLKGVAQVSGLGNLRYARDWREAHQQLRNCQHLQVPIRC